MFKNLVVLFGIWHVMAKSCACLPAIPDASESRTYGLGYPKCDSLNPCEDPGTFCGRNVELISKWLIGARCYPKKGSMGLCNQGVVCKTGVCNIVAFNVGLCL